MRSIERRSLPLPAFFTSPELASLRGNLRELFSSKASREKRLQSFVKRSHGRLEEMLRSQLAEAFHGTCVYCETRDPRGVPYRFRPETEAEPVEDRSTSHLYYAWLATSWDNWLWICSECRPSHEAFFPVAGKRAALPDIKAVLAFTSPASGNPARLAQLYGLDADRFMSRVPPSWSDQEGPDSRDGEKNLLLDPCTDPELWRHLAFAPDWRMVGLTERGKATIEHFKLNRTKLLKDRRNALKGFETRLAGKLLPGEFSEFTSFLGVIQLRLQDLVGRIAQALKLQADLEWPEVIKSFNRLQAHPRWQMTLRRVITAEPGVQPARAPRGKRAPRRPRVVEPAPRLVQFDIENFKSLERLSFKVTEHARQATSREDTNAAGALLILGENATGKSSMLEGAALCLADRRTRDAATCDRRQMVLDPRFMDPGLSGGPDKARLTATFADGSKRELIISDGKFLIDDAPPGQPVFAYGAFRQYLHKSPKRLPADHNIATLFASDRLLPNPTAWLLSLEEDRFRMVARSLHSIFAVEGDFDVIERDHTANRCYVIVEYLDDRGQKRKERTPLESVSSGFRAVLAMACDIMRGLMEGRQARHFQSLINARAIVLVDEIEAHLHPRWKIAIMALLREALPNVTFIATSHDPLCLRGMASGEVMVMNRVRGERAPGSDLPVFIECLLTLPNIEELTIEQLLTADFFQLNSTSSPETDREYARIADLLRRQREAGTSDATRLRERGFKDKEIVALRSFTEDINGALPVGNTEVQRLVQDAVAIYLQKRANATRAGLKTLRASTRGRILKALRSV